MKKLLLILGLMIIFLNLGIVSADICKGYNGYFYDCDDDKYFYFEDYYDYKYYHGDNIKVTDISTNGQDIKVIELRNRNARRYRDGFYYDRSYKSYYDDDRMYVGRSYSKSYRYDYDDDDYRNRRYDKDYYKDKKYYDSDRYYFGGRYSDDYYRDKYNLDYHDNYFEWKDYSRYRDNYDKTVWYRYDGGNVKVRNYYYQEQAPVIYIG